MLVGKIKIWNILWDSQCGATNHMRLNTCMLSQLSHVWLLQPMDCSHPGSCVHGILQARILELVSLPFSRGSSRPIEPRSLMSLAMAGRFCTTEPPGKPPQLSKKNKVLTFENMDWLGRHYVLWNKSDREREMLYVFTHMCNLKIK